MRKLALHWQILIALFLGILYGLYLTDHTGYIEWMGEIFLRALRMIIVPLVINVAVFAAGMVWLAGALETLPEISGHVLTADIPDISESLRLLRQFRTLSENAQ